MNRLESLLGLVLSWEKVIVRIGDNEEEYKSRDRDGMSLKDKLISEIEELLTFESNAIWNHPFFKENQQELLENIEVVLALNKDRLHEWTEEDTTLAKQFGKLIYSKGLPQLPKQTKKAFDSILSKVFAYFPKST